MRFVSPADKRAVLEHLHTEIDRLKATRAAEFEARHMGPFNWSGKELYQSPPKPREDK